MITFLQHCLLQYVSSVSRLVSFFVPSHFFDERLGGYVAADITALVAEAMSSAASSSGSPHHDNNDDDNDIDYDDDSVNEITHEEGDSGKQDHCNGHGSESSSCSNQGPVADSNTAAATSLSLSPSPAVGVLLEVFTEAMNAVPPSCLRGLALQLPDVRNTTLHNDAFHSHISLCHSVLLIHPCLPFRIRPSTPLSFPLPLLPSLPSLPSYPYPYP